MLQQLVSHVTLTYNSPQRDLILNAKLSHQEPGLVYTGSLGPGPQHIGFCWYVLAMADPRSLLKET